jgi:hypothetical protein
LKAISEKLGTGIPEKEILRSLTYENCNFLKEFEISGNSKFGSEVAQWPFLLIKEESGYEEEGGGEEEGEGEGEAVRGVREEEIGDEEGRRGGDEGEDEQTGEGKGRSREDSEKVFISLIQGLRYSLKARQKV